MDKECYRDIEKIKTIGSTYMAAIGLVPTTSSKVRVQLFPLVPSEAAVLWFPRFSVMIFVTTSHFDPQILCEGLAAWQHQHIMRS